MPPVPTARLVVLIAALAIAAVGSSVGCGTDPVGVDACRKIERARCESAIGCGIDLRRPLHSGDEPVNDTAACIRFYDDQCLHGLVTSKEPSPQSVDACVNAIITGDCSVVKEPESSPACSFLVPPAAPAPAPDAGTDAQIDAADASDGSL